MKQATRNKPELGRRPLGRRPREESTQRGASLIELALVLPVLLLLGIGAVDFGRAYYLGIEVASSARAGAQYGAQNAGTTTDIAGMEAAATADASNVSGMTPSASWGCMCSDGSGQTASCTSQPTCGTGTQVVNYVTVSTQANYTPLIPWPGIPSTITLSNTVTYQAGQ